MKKYKLESYFFIKNIEKTKDDFLMELSEELLRLAAKYDLECSGKFSIKEVITRH